MALIALKKDKDCLRVAVATSSRATGRVQFDRALSVELAGATEELSPARLGDKLRAILEKVGVQRGDVTVIVARSEVEMRQIQLPPVPDDELPDMVRFQARNHFSSFSEDSLVDFVPLSQNAEHITVLAASLTDEVVQRIRATVEPAGLRLRHIVVRPFAAAELIRSGHPSTQCRVILEIIGREADISVVENDFILMSRTVRVPDTYTDEKFDAWLPGEIRRTIAAAQGQAGAGEVQEIIVCGSAAEHEQLSKDLQDAFQIETRFVQPFELINKSSRFEQPARNDGFASLLGSLIPASAEERRALDFLNPRKKTERKLDKQKLYMATGIAAAILLLGLFSIWWILGSKQAEITRLQNAINEIRPFTLNTAGTVKNAGILDDWKSRQTDWLEEMYRLSTIMPDPEQTRVTKLFGESERQSDAMIDLEGLLKDSSAEEMRDIRNRLESRPYVVQPNVVPTKEGGFNQKYRIGLQFPFSKIALDGSVFTFDHQQQKNDLTNDKEVTEDKVE